MMYKIAVVTAALCAGSAYAQDPAEGWMAYAVGAMPSTYDRITRLEMTWKVSEDPTRTSAFYSPWFGMDPKDNLNLIQPVNPWLGSGWAMYTEYYQWSPTRNSNSQQLDVKAGQSLHGSLNYDASSDSYTLTQKVVETGATSSQVVKCQNGKKYTLPYVVYEKTWPCSAYPPDGKVHFQDIIVECDGKDCAKEIKWKAAVKDDNCNMAAHINTDGTIDITWDTSLASKYDNMTKTELYNLNMNGWATKLNIEAPTEKDTVCSDKEYCCPDAKHCLTATKVSCAKDATVCEADQACCPLTKLCVDVGAACVSPCESDGEFCCPAALHCLKPTNPGTLCGSDSECSSGTCCPITNECVSVGKACTPP